MNNRQIMQTTTMAPKPAKRAGRANRQRQPDGGLPTDQQRDRPE